MCCQILQCFKKWVGVGASEMSVFLPSCLLFWQQICGFEFSYKLQKMVSDMKLNVDLNNAFSAYFKESLATIDLRVNFSVLVLQASSISSSSFSILG